MVRPMAETDPLPFEVRTSYDFASYPAMDKAIEDAAGRSADFTGTHLPSGERELGWMCGSEIEAKRIERDLKKIGRTARIREIERLDRAEDKPE